MDPDGGENGGVKRMVASALWRPLVIALIFLAAFLLLLSVRKEDSVECDRERTGLNGLDVTSMTMHPMGGPTVAIVGFVAREGSSWFMSLLGATQNVSRIGKICTMGFEPLEHPVKGFNHTIEEIKSLRRDFYMGLTTIENQTKERWLAWIETMNARLKAAHFPRLWIADYCDWRSQVFIFKSRIGHHLDPDSFDAADSLWFEEFSEKFRRNNGKIIMMTRHGVLHRAATNHTGQFLLQEAETEEEKEAVIEANSRVHVDPVTAEEDVCNYFAAAERVARVVRRLRAPSLTIHYENLMDDYEKEMSTVMRFLEVPYEYDLELLKGESRFEKVSPNRLCEKIENFREYCEYFMKTKYAGLLDEPCDTRCEPLPEEA